MPRKYKINDIKKITKDLGCELIDNEYLGNAYKLQFKCKCGNVFKKSLNNFTRYPGCKDCFSKQQSKDRKFTYQEARE